MNEPRPRRPPAAARYELSRRARQIKQELPAESRASGPMITWRASGCRCWVLRVFLTPEGWVLNGRDYPVPMDQWIEWTVPEGYTDETGAEVTLETYRAGKWSAFNPGKVAGANQTLPLDLDRWPNGVGTVVGCDHGRKWFPISDIGEDCNQVRATRASVLRTVAWSE